MFYRFPADKNSPMFLVPKIQLLQPLTDSVARKHIKDISHCLGLERSLTCHDFRRAEASWSFQQGVLLEHIMKHGTWKSDTILIYLSSSITAMSPVARAFQQALHS